MKQYSILDKINLWLLGGIKSKGFDYSAATEEYQQECLDMLEFRKMQFESRAKYILVDTLRKKTNESNH